MYLFPLSYIITGDIIKTPIPNFGIYHIVVGRDPSDGAKLRHDNFLWKLAINRNPQGLSRRALKISIRPDGFICFTAIGKNDCLVKLGKNKEYTLESGSSTIWIDPNDCYNLIVKVAGIYTFQAQSLGGGTDVPFHIEEMVRRN